MLKQKIILQEGWSTIIDIKTKEGCLDVQMDWLNIILNEKR